MSMKDDFIQKFHPDSINANGDRNSKHYARQLSAETYKAQYEAALAVVESWEENETLDVPPFNDDLSKDEMVEHLLTFHFAGRTEFRVGNNGELASRRGTKATKDDLREFHEALHVNAERAGWTMGFKYDSEASIYRLTVETPGPKHKHGAVVLDENQKQVLAAVRSNQKVSGTTLGARDQKVLKELVDNDFGSLKAEMRAFAADTLSAKIADINEEWDAKEKSIPDFATQATEQHRKHYDKVRALRERHAQEMKALEDNGKDAFEKIVVKAKDKGVVLKEGTEDYFDPTTGQKKPRTVFKAEVEGRKEAIAEAQRENTKMVDRALLTVEKQRLTAQRQVLLSSVPDAALPIVESIPDAKTLMVEAQMVPAKEIASTNQS